MGIAHLNDKITESGATGTYLQRHRFVSDKNNTATHDDHQNDWSSTMINLKVVYSIVLTHLSYTI